MFFKRLKEKISKEDKNGYYSLVTRYVYLIKKVKHQGIGGKKAFIDRKLDLQEVIDNACNFNMACMNFVKRRPDLFKSWDEFTTIYFDDRGFIYEDMLSNPGYAFKMDYYYVKVLQTDSKNSCYLGYVIASDEIKGGKFYESND